MLYIFHPINLTHAAHPMSTSMANKSPEKEFRRVLESSNDCTEIFGPSVKSKYVVEPIQT